MIKESITVDEVLAILNSAVEDDRDAMQRLIETRVPCNDELGDHPTIQAQGGLIQGNAKVGLLGILNGLFGISESGFGVISAVYDENKLVRFERTDIKYLKSASGMMVVTMSEIDNEG